MVHLKIVHKDEMQMEVDQEEEVPMTPAERVHDHARFGELEEMKQLIESGAASADSVDEYGATALHKAAANGHSECVQYLISKGVKHTPNSTGATPLHWAMLNKATDVVLLLLRSFPDVDVADVGTYGKSILSTAFATGEETLIKACLEHQSASKLESGQPPVEEDTVLDSEGAPAPAS